MEHIRSVSGTFRSIFNHCTSASTDTKELYCNEIAEQGLQEYVEGVKGLQVAVVERFWWIRQVGESGRGAEGTDHLSIRRKLGCRIARDSYV